MPTHHSRNRKPRPDRDPLGLIDMVLGNLAAGGATPDGVTSPRAPTQPVALESRDRVLIRPIREEDKQSLVEGFQRLSAESRYRRFFSPVHELSAHQLRYLTEVDHHAHEALLATDPSTGEGLGVARFIRSTTDPRVAEVAVAVGDSWQGRGLGTALLEALAARAREEGVDRFTGSVLAGNSPMLRLLRRLGPSAALDRAGGVVEFEIDLGDVGFSLGSRTRRLKAQRRC
jgi:RimJ/RimL family protein N-acetyltransferase